MSSSGASSVENAANVRVYLKPSPSFCVKSAVLKSPNVTAIPPGLKVFVNICWDQNVPPPPDASEEVIQNAMVGHDADTDAPDAWYVPVIVSDGRRDTDKAGKSSLVFDCVFSSSLKSRSLKDPQFRTFLTELALQNIETQTSLTLSGVLGTPNIASKGKPEAHTTFIPAFLYPPGHKNHQAHNESPKKGPLIQEIEPTRKTSTDSADGITRPEVPAWSWSSQGNSLYLTIEVPKLARSMIPSSTLDLETRRIILNIPSLYALDINLDLSDAKFMAVAGQSESEHALRRARELNIDRAKAEWRVADGVIVITA